jgi:GT2 family glycosyltransferase
MALEDDLAAVQQDAGFFAEFLLRDPGPEREIPRVTAVLVLHDGVEFLPRTLAAVQSQTRPPDVLIGVDAGSRDDGPSLLRAATPHVLQLRRDTSFGDAVHAALTTLEGHRLDHRDPDRAAVAAGAGAAAGAVSAPAPPAEWLWLLHDDCAPSPEALQLLLDVVDRGPSIGIAGCKQVGWDDARRLIDVGFTTSLLGARVTGIDVDDVDQGQLDHRSDVLAVSTSGMLIRRDLWERLGGPDPALSHARADLDLCRRAHLAGQRVVVVPAAVVAHAAATATGRRGETGRLTWAVRDRRAAVHLRLAAAPWFVVPFLAVWLAGAAVVRAAGRVALKQPEQAGGELLAFVLALASPLALWRARRRMRRGRLIRRRDFRRLLASPRQVLRQRRDAVTAYLRAQEAAWAQTAASGSATSGSARPGPRERSPLHEARDRSGAVRLIAIIAVLAAASGVAGLRLMLSGTGQVLGPALLPMPSSAGQLWWSAESGWRPAGLGLAAAGDPLNAVLALIAWPLGGSPSSAVALLLLAALPASALLAWWAAGGVTASRTLRTWAACAWTASPALLFAVATGRISAVLAHLVLPPAALLLARTTAVARTGPYGSGPRLTRGGAIAASSTAGLLITVLLAAAPALTVPVVLVLLVALFTGSHGRRSVAWATIVPAVVLLPWWLAVAKHPLLLLSEPGGPSGTPAELTGASSWQLALWPLDPARIGPGPLRSLAGQLAQLLQPVLPAADAALVLRGAAVLLALPLLLAGLSALAVRPAPTRWITVGAVRFCWLIALVAATAGVLLPTAQLGTGATGGTLVWPGALVSLLTAAILVAALCRLDGAAARLRLHSAGWRHVGSVLLGSLAVLMPVLLLAGWASTGWTAQAGAWVHRGSPDAVPAVAAAEADSAAATRTLALDVGPQGVRWVLYRSGGPRTGEWSAAASLTADARSGRADQPMLDLIGSLLSDAGSDQRAALANAGIGSIVLLKDSDPQVSQALDTATGLARVASSGRGLLWRVELDDAGSPTRPARARILSRDGQVLATLRSAQDEVRARVPASGQGRLLVLTERADPNWKAWLDGRRLTPLFHAGWAQAFDLPLAGGRLRVAYEPANTSTVNAARLIVAGIALLGAVPLPIRRRRFLPPPPRSVPVAAPAAEAPAEIPAEGAAEMPAEAPAEVLAEAPAETPAEAAAEAAASELAPETVGER